MIFGSKKPVLKPAYYQAGYQEHLHMLGFKIKQGVKQGYSYENIPFGNSLLDIDTDGKDVQMIFKYLSKGEWIPGEVFNSKVEYMDSYFFSPVILKGWDKNDSKYDFEPVVFDQIVKTIAELVWDSVASSDYWVFPFFNHLIIVEKNTVIDENLVRNVSGNAYLREIEDEYGYGGTVMPSQGIKRNYTPNATRFLEDSLASALSSGITHKVKTKEWDYYRAAIFQRLVAGSE